MRLTLFSCLAVALASPATAQMNDFDKTLLNALKRNPDFIRQIPQGHVIRDFERTGGVSAGQIIWGPNPSEIDIRPVAIGNKENVNCFSNRPQEFSGGIDTGYLERSSFTTTVGSSLSRSFSVEASWPGVGNIGSSITAEITSEVGRTTETTRSVTFPHDYVAIVDPLHYSIAQLQVFEQSIEGQPFEVDIAISGNARIIHAPDVQWLSGSAARRAAKVIAGTEKDARGNPRPLAVCRAERNDVMHPGKIVGANCNYGFAGKEHRARRYETLSMPKGSYRWVDRRDFEKDNEDNDVANGDTDAVIAGNEERVDRYDGQLLVCRAEHKDAWHPGKVVDRDCMFGYGGKEIEKGRYQVLVRKEVEEETLTIRLIDYLPPDLLSYRHKGEFEGTHSVDSKIVLSDQQPVTAEMCPSLLVQTPEAGAEDPTLLPREVTVTRSSPTGDVATNDRVLAAVETKSGEDASGLVKPGQAQTALLDGTVLSAASLNDGTNPIDWNLRTLRWSRPFMRGTDVLVVQKALTDAGWPVLQDGVFGGYTARAVQLFQRANGLPVDGVVGPETEARLGL